jgi:hypothetical protein
MTEIGEALATGAAKILEDLRAQQGAFRRDASLSCRSQPIELPYRKVTPHEINGTARGAQRFIDNAIYERNIPAVVNEINAAGGVLLTELQAMHFDDRVYVAFPCELFVKLGLRLKEQAHPRRAHAVGSANAYIGYVPPPKPSPAAATKPPSSTPAKWPRRPVTCSLTRRCA